MNTFFNDFRSGLRDFLRHDAGVVFKSVGVNVLPILFVVWMLLALVWVFASSPSMILTVLGLSFFLFVFVVACILFVQRMVMRGQEAAKWRSEHSEENTDG